MIGIGLIALLLPGVAAETVDPKVERLERLERALQIEDCAYAVEELEHLNVSYSAMALRYALLAEGYLCIGKPEKSKLAVQEFARLGGEANQLSMRVQEFCALQQCSLTPVLVKPVEQESTTAVEIVQTSMQDESTTEVSPPVEVAEVRIAPIVETEAEVEEVVDIAAPTETSPEVEVAEITPVRPPEIVDPIVAELEKVESSVPEDIEEVRIEPESDSIGATGTVPEGATLFSVAEINGMVVDGQCAQAASAGATLVAVEPENALAHMSFGDALACFPEGSGDIFAAFDAWMIAKSLAKTQQLDWQPMKERLGWALERSGIVKVVPEFTEGYTEWPEDFAIDLDSSREVDLAPRTDYMLGGIYLTNLPEGESTLRITPGGARPDVVQTLTIKAGELQKVRVPIGPEKHMRLPVIPAPDGYVVTFVNEAGDETVYDPHESQLLLKDTYTTTVQYGEQNYEIQMDLNALTEEFSEESAVKQAFRDLLPWVYQVRNPNGELLSEGLVYPDQDTQDVTVELNTVSYSNWRDGVDVDASQTNAIQLVASGTIFELDESLFSELVIDPELHPFYDSAEALYDAEQDIETTGSANQWLTGTMLTAGVWTGVSLALANGDRPDVGFWESQAVAGAMLTIPMVAIWMNEKIRVEPSQNRQGESLYASLMAMNRDPVSFDELTPQPEELLEEDAEEEIIEDTPSEESTLSESEQLVEETEEVEEVETQEAEAVEDPEESDGDSSQ